MSKQSGQIYEFGEYRLDTDERILRRDGELVALTPTTFELLLALVENSGHILEKDALMQRLWPDSFVEEGNLARNVSRLRAALGVNNGERDYIETVPRRGYRFVAEVHEKPQGSSLEGQGKPVGIESPANLDSVLLLRRGIEAEDLRHEEERRRRRHEETDASRTSISPVNTTGAGKKRVALGVAAVILAAAIPLWFLGVGRQKPATTPVFTRLSGTGNIQAAALSPDGNYVAYAEVTGRRESALWLRHLPTLSKAQLVPPSDVVYHSVCFSPRGEHILYARTDQQVHLLGLYRIPLLGGVPEKLIDDVDSRVSFSPDGKRIVFRRQLRAERESALIVANLDGTGEQQIASLKKPEDFGTPAWSPDGKVIACAAGHAQGGANRYLVELRVADWAFRRVSSRRWRWLGDVAWRSNRELLVIASDRRSNPYQLWRVTYPDGDVHQVTHGHSDYKNLDLSAAGRLALVLQTERITSLWTVPAADARRAKQISSTGAGYAASPSWTPDGGIVVLLGGPGLKPGIKDIVVIGPGGGDERPMVFQAPLGLTNSIRVSPDGRRLLLASESSGVRHVWRVDIDGRNLMQLTNGNGEDLPAWSPDGKWVAYTEIGSALPTAWRVSAEGGTAIQLTERFCYAPDVSPDGGMIACFTSDGKPGVPWRIAIFPAAGGEPIQILGNPMSSGAPVRWTPDGGALTFADTQNGSVNLWQQALAGGGAKQLTHFASDQIFGFDWSRDGSQLACIRGTWAQNIILIDNPN